MKLLHVTTVPETLGFLRGQLEFMRKRGFKVHVVSSPGPFLERSQAWVGGPTHAINMTRSISPLQDLAALSKLYRLFRKIKPTIVHANTPKGGLLGVLAARLAGVPVVIYGMRGLPFVTATGLKMRVLMATETIACTMAHRVIAVSSSIRQRTITQGICRAGKIFVLGRGSGNGVDAEIRFNPRQFTNGFRGEIRETLHIPPDSIVIGYVGRIVRDKGITELEAAWQSLRLRFNNLFLILTGPIEPQDPVPPAVLNRLRNDPRVRLTGELNEPARIYTAMDILTLPSFREGFPNTPLEAAAMELPVVTTTADGCREAVVHGVTGLVVPPGDSLALTQALEQLILNPAQRTQMGKQGRQRVLGEFRPDIIWTGLYHSYMELLTAKAKLPLKDRLFQE